MPAFLGSATEFGHGMHKLRVACMGRYGIGHADASTSRTLNVNGHA
jgi:hypothetical protein